MTLRFVDGFDHYISSTIAQIQRKWSVVGNAGYTLITSANTRFNTGQAIQCNGGGSSASGIGKTLDSKGTWIIGFALKIPSIDPSRPCFLQICDASTPQISMGILTSGSIVLKRGAFNGTVIGTSMNAIPITAWIYMEVKCVIHPSAGSIIIRINGQTFFSLTGVNTSNTGSSVATGISFGDAALQGAFNNAIQCQFDDIYICDGSGTTNNDFLGDIRVDTLYPSGAGANAQWTANGAGTNVACVSGVVPDDDTTYVETLTPGNVDTYQLSDISTATPGAIYGLQAVLMARKTDAGSRFISEAYRIGGTVYVPVAGSGLPVYDGYFFNTDLQELSPATTGAWTASEVNALEVGIKLIS